MQPEKKKKGYSTLEGLLPEDILGQKFLQYFYHPWGFIYAPVPSEGERPAWQTESRYPIQPRNLWSQYLNPDVLLGLKFGKWTRYLMLDIDRNSQYHPYNNPQAYGKVLAALEKIGLCRPVVIQSSDSGGIHIYYFFGSEIHSFSLACAVWLALKEARLTTKGGQLEIFPNPKPYSKDKPTSFKAHRLPLQAGSYILDADWQIESNDLAKFLRAANWSAQGQDDQGLQQAIAAASKQKMFWSDNGMSNAVFLWQQDLLERIREGWTDFHQTNDLLKDIACYGIVFGNLSGLKLIDYIVTTALAAPGYHQYCRHQHEIERRAAEWAKCCEGFYTPYPSYPNRSASYREHFAASYGNNNLIAFPHPNQQRQQETLERITAVVANLKGQGKFPATASERAKAIIAASKQQYGKGTSQTTLHKPEYLWLWHPLHEGQENTPTPKQHVNASPEPVIAPLQPEKYPKLPDPWLADENLEPLLQHQTQQIYTPPPIMKVFYLPSADASDGVSRQPAISSQREILNTSENRACENQSPENQESNSHNPQFVQDEILLETVNPQSENQRFKNPEFNSHNQQSDCDSSVIHKQSQCLSNSGDCQKFDKSDLSIIETIGIPIHSPNITEPVSSADSDIVINLQSAPVSVPASIPTSPPVSIPFSIPVSIHPGVSNAGSSAPDTSITSHAAASLPDVSSPEEPESSTGTADGIDSNSAINTVSCTPEQHREAARLKLQTIAQAKHWVKTYCMAEDLHLPPVLRQKMEQLAQRLLMRESSSPILRHEAEQWLAENPPSEELLAHLQNQTRF
ncbi:MULTISPECIES: hypothetical protein [unclassified Tolypothrix]|uniref:hypothetical protein n=1 Tax=unclassified Tolypothrix TaxID=2649714 RepID=UPI0005F7D204|nr:MULTISPECIES: hypothetical protein [unclassified Tolypothrix]MBE9082297.1 hypothetical protein [Tolypothrix sp. LEGE 11397]UYD30758.1 hypothetical protein HGR01_38320 [Tolypothrix sp. PCC 7712]UYD38630.1 hypothetical protein HG267_39720 [Tolypothrix sp. PCC 7601]BAY95729.1 hypothetical protein NIES3275_78060 [Microchaete diplosiphon NIES-3275]